MSRLLLRYRRASAFDNSDVGERRNRISPLVPSQYYFPLKTFTLSCSLFLILLQLLKDTGQPTSYPFIHHLLLPRLAHQLTWAVFLLDAGEETRSRSEGKKQQHKRQKNLVSKTKQTLHTHSQARNQTHSLCLHYYNKQQWEHKHDIEVIMSVRM